MSSRRVLLLGARLGALAAAEKLGLEVCLLHPRPLARALAARAPRAARFDPAAPAEELLGRAEALLGGARPDAVLGLTEGTVRAAALLRAAYGLGGTGVESASRCTDKIAMKRAADAAGMPCAQWEEVGAQSSGEELARRLGLPVVLKESRSSGSRGLTMARDAAAVNAALPRCNLAERFVAGREMSVESFFQGGELLFENPTEYLVPLHASIVPAALDASTWSAVRALNRLALSAMGLERGMAHVELFLGADGPVFGEIAARPPGGRLMQLLGLAYGFDPWQALLRIELGERPVFPSRAQAAAGAWMLHPGEGKIARVSGLEEAAAIPGVRHVRCRVRPGERVAKRQGSGQDVGSIEAAGANRDEVALALWRAHAALRIELRPVRPARPGPVTAALYSPLEANGRMSEIRIQSEGEGSFRVEVRDGAGRTVHAVRASDEDLRRYGGSDDPEGLIRAAFEFLLEREPKEAILRSFELPVIERYFPEFPAAIRGRLG